ALTGAGATFPAPIYSQWFTDFRKVESGAKVNYQAIGSGGGVTQFTQGTVDFGASDAPLKAAEQAALPGGADGALEIPTVLGGVAIAYNVQGLQTGLKLDGTTAAGVSQNDGTVGYLSFDFAVTSNLGIAQIKRDSDGQFIAPSVDSISAAGGILQFPISETTNILNSSAPGAYPISTTTYVLVYKD